MSKPARSATKDCEIEKLKGLEKVPIVSTVASAVRAALKPAYSYARFSDKKQKPVSIEDQERICDELAAAYGAYIPPENRFRDEAKKGSLSREKRPGWSALCKLIEAGAVNVLFADEHSRLFRNGRESVDIQDQMDRHNMTVICRGFDTTGGDDWHFMWAINSAVGIEEIRRLSRRIKRAQKGLVANGKATCPEAYGYARKVIYNSKGDREYSVYEVDPVESAVVRRIFAERKAGVSYSAIARGLTADAIPSPSGGAVWGKGSLTKIIDRPLYYGVYTFGPNTSLQSHLALISADDWSLVQPKARGISQTGRGGGKHWAAGLIHCGACGYSMTVVVHKACTPALVCCHCQSLQQSGFIEHVSRCNVRTAQAALQLGTQLILTPERVAAYRECIRRAGARTSEGDLEALKIKVAAVDKGSRRIADLIATIDDDAAAKPFQEQARILLQQRSALSLAILQLRLKGADLDKAAIEKQLKVDPRHLVPALFAKVLQPHELRSLLNRLFPLILIERRERHEVMFILTVCAGALFSTLTDTPSVDMPQQSYRIRVVPNGRYPVKSVELVGLVEAPEPPERFHSSDPRCKAVRAAEYASLNQGRGLGRLASVPERAHSVSAEA